MKIQFSKMSPDIRFLPLKPISGQTASLFQAGKGALGGGGTVYRPHNRTLQDRGRGGLTLSF